MKNENEKCFKNSILNIHLMAAISDHIINGMVSSGNLRGINSHSTNFVHFSYT